MKPWLHDDLTRGGLLAAGESLCNWDRVVGRGQGSLHALRCVLKGNRAQDRPIPGQLQPERHVDCATFSMAAARQHELWQLITDRDRELAAGWNRASAKHALRALGAVLHAVQDMPSHSNWVEMHVGEQVPLWDWRRTPTPKGPSPVLSGTFFLASGCDSKGDWPDGVPVEDRPNHHTLNKDSPRGGHGRELAADGVPFHQHAYDLALRHSAVEFAALRDQAPNLHRWILLGAPPTCARMPADVGRTLAELREQLRRGDRRAAASSLVVLDDADDGLARHAIAAMSGAESHPMVGLV